LIPLLIQLYQDAYPKERRGRLFSRTVMIRIALAAIFAEAGGRFLSWHLEWFQGLLLVFGLSMLAGGWCLSRCPSTRLSAKQSPALFGAWRFVREDVQFRWTLYCWMLMGLANLMMLPLRVEYLANPKYGLALSATTIAVLTGVIPNAARLVMSSVWGYLFDRMNFFVLRIVLNLCFAVGIFSFFTGAGWGGLVGGALVFGVATAGGDVAWSLWVTKMTPPEHVAEYMSVHTFLTGVRGVVAPWLAFQAAQIYALTTLAWVCAGMIVVATVMLIPEIRAVRNRRGVPLVEEVVE
jgi:hypothetical protein